MSIILVVEVYVEFLKVLQRNYEVFRRRNQVRHAVMVCVLFLSEAAAWYRHDASCIHHIHAVHKVRRYSFFSCFIHGFLREAYLWECVHGSLDTVTVGVIHYVEGVSQQLGTLPHSIVNSLTLLGVKLDAL